jgi:1,4-dihydroxy-2-naphthoate octaprenyltransferase
MVRAENSMALLALCMPSLVGMTLAWWEFGRFDPVVGLFVLATVITFGWGLNALSEYADFRHSQRYDTRTVREPFSSGYDLMRRRIVRSGTVRDVGLILLLIALAFAGWLAMLAGWPMLFFYAMALVIGVAGIWLPPLIGYRIWGLGEATVFLSHGLLPVVAAFYAHAHTLTWLPFWASLAYGMFAVLWAFNTSFLHHRRDWLMHKRTLTVTLGLARGLDASALLSVSTYVAVLLLVTLTDLPLLALVGVAALPIAVGAFAQIHREYLTPEDCFHLDGAAAQASVLTGLLISAALLVDKLL